MSVPNLNPPFAAGHAVVERTLLRKFAGFTYRKLNNKEGDGEKSSHSPSRMRFLKLLSCRHNMNRQSFEASRTKVGIVGFLPRSQGSPTHPPTGQRMAKAPKLAAAPFSRFAYLHG
jgi:hypothetical protein